MPFLLSNFTLYPDSDSYRDYWVLWLITPNPYPNITLNHSEICSLVAFHVVNLEPPMYPYLVPLKNAFESGKYMAATYLPAFSAEI